MSKSFLNVLHARQPKLDYISPAICEYIFSGSGFSSFLLDEDWNDDPVSTATIVTYGSGGDHRLFWDPTVGAVCYMIYQADDPLNPLTSTYTLVADCVPCCTWDPPSPPTPVCPDPLDCPPPPQPCYTIQALTDAGLSPLSVPVCPNPPTSCPQCNGGGGGSSSVSCFDASQTQSIKLGDYFDFTPVLLAPQSVSNYTIVSGTVPTGMTFIAATGVIAGVPTALGSFPVLLRVNYSNGLGCTQLINFVVGECINTTSPLPDAWVDAPYVLDFTATTPVVGESWEIINGALPAGVTFTAAGELSGIPEVAGTYNFTVEYTAGDVACTRDYTWVVGEACISTDGPLTTGMEGEAYSQTLLASTPEANQEWTITSGFLPTTLALNLNTGEIAGTPDLGTAGDYAITVRLTNQDTSFCEENYSLTILANPTDCVTNNAVLAPGQEDAPYGPVTLLADSPEVGQVWSIVDGALPPGLTLDGSTGEISGTPAADSADLYFFIVRLTNVDTSYCEKEFEIAVLPAEGLCINMPGFNILPDAEESVAYSETLVAANPEAGQVWSVVGGAFPTGLSLAGAVISGTPDPGTAGTYYIDIRLTNLDTTYCEVNFSLTVGVSDCISTSSPLPDCQETVAYSQGLTAAVPEGGQVWSITAGSLPTGLTLDSGTGVISGTPDSGPDEGLYPFTVRLTNLDTTFCEKAFQITLLAAPLPDCPDFSNQGALTIEPGDPFGSGYTLTPPAPGAGASKTVVMSCPAGGVGALGIAEYNSYQTVTTDTNCNCQVQVQIAPVAISAAQAQGSVTVYLDGVQAVARASASFSDGTIDETLPFVVPAGTTEIRVRVTVDSQSTGSQAASTSVTYILSTV